MWRTQLDRYFANQEADVARTLFLFGCLLDVERGKKRNSDVKSLTTYQDSDDIEDRTARVLAYSALLQLLRYFDRSVAYGFVVNSLIVID
jgi:hypothetical protein